MIIAIIWSHFMFDEYCDEQNCQRNDNAQFLNNNSSSYNNNSSNSVKKDQTSGIFIKCIFWGEDTLLLNGKELTN
jgi:hypothetical protein